jgi:hypothetical protein
MGNKRTSLHVLLLCGAVNQPYSANEIVKVTFTFVKENSTKEEWTIVFTPSIFFFYDLSSISVGLLSFSVAYIIYLRLRTKKTFRVTFQSDIRSYSPPSRVVKNVRSYASTTPCAA